MLFPWVGMLEQIRRCDVYVHYDDVQFSKGSFTNRVQVKTVQGPVWMTVPLKNTRLGQAIKDVEVNEMLTWREKHLALLEQSHARAPHLGTMMDLVRKVYASNRDSLANVVEASLHAVCGYYGILDGKRVARSSELGLAGKGSQRVLDLVRRFEGTHYITGHGAADYLDHAAFEREGIRVGYMDYQKKPYPQLHGEFTPFVTSLDLIANCGKSGLEWICSGTRNWKEFCQ